MLFEFCIYFLIFGFITMFFITLTSDTREMRADDAERLDSLNSVLVTRVAPSIAFIAVVLIPVVIVCGV